MRLTIWSNAKFSDSDTQLLVEGTRGHQLVFSANASASVLTAGQPDPQLAEADIAFGQPDPAQCLANEKLKWVEVTSAGYTRYDTPEFQEAFRARGARFSNVSEVFADPCAQLLQELGFCVVVVFGRSL